MKGKGVERDAEMVGGVRNMGSRRVWMDDRDCDVKKNVDIIIGLLLFSPEARSFCRCIARA